MGPLGPLGLLGLQPRCGRTGGETTPIALTRPGHRRWSRGKDRISGRIEQSKTIEDRIGMATPRCG
eukprot:15429476-Alexandrium_andersonii.AAC.1